MRAITFEAAVVAAAAAEAPYAEIQALRKSPPRFPGVEVPGHFLKHVDEQTVVAMLAVRRAVERFELDVREQTQWAIVSAPRYIGRISAYGIVERFDRAGTSSVPTHSAAQYSLNSIAGVAGIAMGIRGPSLGVGGGPGSIADAFTSSLTMFDPAVTPGVWLIAAEWDSEPTPDAEGAIRASGVCRAAALALRFDAAGGSMVRLRMNGAARLAEAFEPRIADLAACIATAERGLPGTWAAPLPAGGTMELHLKPIAARLRAAA